MSLLTDKKRPGITLTLLTFKGSQTNSSWQGWKLMFNVLKCRRRAYTPESSRSGDKHGAKVAGKGQRSFRTFIFIIAIWEQKSVIRMVKRCVPSLLWTHAARMAPQKSPGKPDSPHQDTSQQSTKNLRIISPVLDSSRASWPHYRGIAKLDYFYII